MFESKFFTIMAVVSLLLLLGIVGFQYSELDRYEIIDKWMNSAK